MRLLALSFAGCAGLLPLLFVGDASAAGPAALAKAHGAVVIALGEGSVTIAAKPLAREVYRDGALRAAVDDATARVLVGEAPPEGAPLALRDLAQVRGTISSSVDDAAARRLLASIGAEAHAEIVVVVSIASERTIARVLRVEPARYEPVELVPLIERTDAGEARFSWPGVAATLHRWITPLPEAPPPLAPLKATAPEAPKEAPKKPFYASPWFWGPVGAVVVVGAAVLIASRVTADDPSTVHLSGTVSP